MKKSKLVCGVGINDADYNVTKMDGGVEVWRCPFHHRWSHMITRCYSAKYQRKGLTYKDCSVDDEWHSFMAFRDWMIMQDWKGNALDKDLKVIGNKIYSPDNCMFIPVSVNSFTTDSGSSRGNYPIGVSKFGNRFRSRISILNNNSITLGIFSTPEEAYEAWRNKKIELAYKLQDQQDNLEVRQGIQNYIDNILIKDHYLHQWLISNGKTRHPTHQTTQ